MNHEQMNILNEILHPYFSWNVDWTFLILMVVIFVSLLKILYDNDIDYKYDGDTRKRIDNSFWKSSIHVKLCFWSSTISKHIFSSVFFPFLLNIQLKESAAWRPFMEHSETLPCWTTKVFHKALFCNTYLQI